MSNQKISLFLLICGLVCSCNSGKSGRRGSSSKRLLGIKASSPSALVPSASKPLGLITEDESPYEDFNKVFSDVTDRFMISDRGDVFYDHKNASGQWVFEDSGKNLDAIDSNANAIDVNKSIDSLSSNLVIPGGSGFKQFQPFRFKSGKLGMVLIDSQNNLIVVKQSQSEKFTTSDLKNGTIIDKSNYVSVDAKADGTISFIFGKSDGTTQVLAQRKILTEDPLTLSAPTPYLSVTDIDSHSKMLSDTTTSIKNQGILIVSAKNSDLLTLHAINALDKKDQAAAAANTSSQSKSLGLAGVDDYSAAGSGVADVFAKDDPNHNSASNLCRKIVTGVTVGGALVATGPVGGTLLLGSAAVVTDESNAADASTSAAADAPLTLADVLYVDPADSVLSSADYTLLSDSDAATKVILSDAKNACQATQSGLLCYALEQSPSGFYLKKTTGPLDSLKQYAATDIALPAEITLSLTYLPSGAKLRLIKKDSTNVYSIKDEVISDTSSTQTIQEPDQLDMPVLYADEADDGLQKNQYTKISPSVFDSANEACQNSSAETGAICTAVQYSEDFYLKNSAAFNSSVAGFGLGGTDVVLHGQSLYALDLPATPVLRFINDKDENNADIEDPRIYRGMTLRDVYDKVSKIDPDSTDPATEAKLNSIIARIRPSDLWLLTMLMDADTKAAYEAQIGAMGSIGLFGATKLKNAFVGLHTFVPKLAGRLLVKMTPSFIGKGLQKISPIKNSVIKAKEWVAKKRASIRAKVANSSVGKFASKTKKLYLSKTVKGRVLRVAGKATGTGVAAVGAGMLMQCDNGSCDTAAGAGDAVTSVATDIPLSGLSGVKGISDGVAGPLCAGDFQTFGKNAWKIALGIVTGTASMLKAAGNALCKYSSMAVEAAGAQKEDTRISCQVIGGLATGAATFIDSAGNLANIGVDAATCAAQGSANCGENAKKAAEKVLDSAAGSLQSIFAN